RAQRQGASTAPPRHGREHPAPLPIATRRLLGRHSRRRAPAAGATAPAADNAGKGRRILRRRTDDRRGTVEGRRRPAGSSTVAGAVSAMAWPVSAVAWRRVGDGLAGVGGGLEEGRRWLGGGSAV